MKDVYETVIYKGLVVQVDLTESSLIFPDQSVRGIDVKIAAGGLI